MNAERTDLIITVNGTLRRFPQPEPGLLLVDLLHEELGLTGTKFGCGMGICRACTVAVRKNAGTPLEAICACSITADALEGYEVLTVEGLAPPGDLSSLQQAFLDAFAFQCGYCAPGFLMAASVLIDRLRRNPIAMSKLDEEIARACGDHVCRCTGYRRYHEAIRDAITAHPGLTIQDT